MRLESDILITCCFLLLLDLFVFLDQSTASAAEGRQTVRASTAVDVIFGADLATVQTLQKSRYAAPRENEPATTLVHPVNADGPIKENMRHTSALQPLGSSLWGLSRRA